MAEASLEVVVPAYNGHDALVRCLAALERHTGAAFPIRLVDDASTDPRVLPLLRAFAERRPGTMLVQNETNLGFVGSVNAALAGVHGDVVLLNADTEVTQGWLEGLLRCRDSAPRIGIVCPLSNNATLLSVAGLEALFGAADHDSIADCVRRAGPPRYPRIPTAVGFCMLVTRALLDTVGLFDAAYGRGYGEENDFSMRALDRGFEIACCDDVYVHHAGEASFREIVGSDAARERNRLLLARRWPCYAPGVSAWMRANPLRSTVERIQAECERDRLPGRPRVLHVMHAFDSPGGVEQHTRAIIDALRDDVAFNVVVPGATTGAWTDFVHERRGPHLRISQLNADLQSPGMQVLEFSASVRDEGVERAFQAFLHGGYDVVHFHSLLGWNTLQLPRLARESGARVVLSVHDLGWMCADYNMVTGSEERPCGRTAARGSDAGCVECLKGKSILRARDEGDGLAEFIDERTAAAASAMAAADVVVCPSRYAADRVAAAFGPDAARNVRVIGHGVPEMPRIYRAAERRVLTVAHVGRFNPRKGASHFIELARRLEGQGIVFESWGPVDERLRESARKAGIALRGPYAPADLALHLRGVDLVVIPSTLEETFCLTLSEMHALGIPVAAARTGAIPERIRHGDNGFLFEVGDVGAMAELLVRLRDDRRILADVAIRLAEERPKTSTQNAAEYLAIYRELAAGRGHDRRLAQGHPIAAMGALGFPRERRRTPLGDDDYDRWLAVEPPTASACESAAPAIRTIVLTEAASSDAQALRTLNRAIAESGSEWVVLIEKGDLVAEAAPQLLAEAMRCHPRAALLYGDHDAISGRGERYDPVFKPRFDAELLRHAPYIAGLCAIRRERCIAMGGLREPGWLGVVEFALRLAALEDPALVVSVRGLLVHRLDTNLAGLDRPDFRRRMNEIVTGLLARAGTPAVRLSASPGTPAMWARTLAHTSGVSVYLRCADSARDAAAGLEALLQRSASRVTEVFVDLPEATAAELRRQLAGAGIGTPVHALEMRAGGALAEALWRAGGEWIAVIDARCRGFSPGWLERLAQGIAGPFVAGIAPDLATPNGGRVSGAQVLGGGPWSVAGPMPIAVGPEGLASLYDSPREVSCLSPHLSLWRGEAVRNPAVLADLALAGRYDIAQLSSAIRERGLALLVRPFVAAQLETGSPPKSVAETQIPADVAWMRERWNGRLEDDPCFHPALAPTSARVAIAPRFAPMQEGVTRICAFPFDHWGSGEIRVRQPCAALEREGLADIAMMETHDTGRVPNGLEWQRLGADTLLAHNFFHDFQLVALDEYARRGNALRVLGIDDLLTQLPAGNPYAATIYPDIAARIARAVARCDRLVVSTPELADAYGGATDVRVIPNAIDLRVWESLRNMAREAPRPRVGWAGARQHLGDLALLEEVMAATAGEVDWIFLGMCPPALRRHAAEFHAMVPVRDYPAKLASLGLDIAVAPLRDNAFNRAKSDLKILEYGVLGIPVVASAVGPYAQAPALLAHDRDAWIDAIRMLARDLDGARGRGMALRHWVLTHRSLTAMLPSWRRALSREG